MMNQGPGFLVTFLYYFSLTTLIVLLVTSQGMGMSLETKVPYQLGTLSGLIAGLIGANFNRSVTMSVSFQNQKEFMQNLHEALAEMGFDKKIQQENWLVYEKSALSTVFSGKIYVQTEKNSVTITSRSRNIKKLSQII